MFHFDQDAGDDPGFVNEVAGLVQGAIVTSAPDAAVIVKVDSWFGSKWLGFSHKVMGAFGVAYPEDLVMPPFVPNRVVIQRNYNREGAAFVQVFDALPLHVEQRSEANARRRLRDSHPNAALFWWTGDTLQSGRGALMAYLPATDGHLGWYAELRRKGRWVFGQLRGIGGAELRALQARAPTNHGGLVE